MKTYDGKNITKKHIAEVLRTQDSTKIYALYKRIYGNVKKSGIHDFIHEYAPTQCIYHMAYELAYNNKHQIRRGSIESTCIIRHGFYKGDARKDVVDLLKRECQDVKSPYAKRPMMGYTHLYFCSPVYGHSDYNKACMIPIKGNERFCELVIKYADKFFAPVYDIAEE